MKIKKSQLRKIILESLLLEGKAEEVVKANPKIQPAYDAGIKNHVYLMWLSKTLGTEPIKDVIPVVQAFDRMKQRLKSKQKSTNIDDYENASDIRQTLESLGSSKKLEVQGIKEKETTYLGTFGDWIVAMPHTTKSSCLLGTGTTWCTAATKSKNLFLSYIADPNNDIILYYLLRKGIDSREDPEAKLSIGFIDGSPYLKGDDGNITVDAKNKGIDKNRLSSILGNQFVPIMNAMKNHANLIGGKHPGKEELLNLIKQNNSDKIDEMISKMNFDEQIHFIEVITYHEVASPQVLSYLFDHAESLWEEYHYVDDSYDVYDDYQYSFKRSIEEENAAQISDIKDVMYLIRIHKNTPPKIKNSLSNYLKI